ncbi:MAG: hypothetical protein CM1200mP18_14850 [Gammaproteobacteria bacterium]|nr:MAG: hypothetical protein CM1200mP18_14850 [Gammaproteobacteria bacterium]
MPCLDDLNILATITGPDRTSVTPDVATLSEQVPGIDVPTLWNGLFFKKGTPQIVKDKFAAVAKRVVASDAVAKVPKDTGGIFFWEGPAGPKHVSPGAGSPPSGCSRRWETRNWLLNLF